MSIQTLVPFALAFLVGCDADHAVSQQTADRGIVFYYDFSIQRVTGLHEHEIETYGCRFEIRREDFERAILQPREGQLTYRSRDVRAKIVFGDETIYVDSFGVASGSGGGMFAIDKSRFTQALTPVGVCRL